jgi:hypothetical protein
MQHPSTARKGRANGDTEVEDGMEIHELTDEQIAKLTPEQITELENNPDKVDEILAGQTATNDKPKQEGEDAANGAGKDEEEPVVLNKSGKGVIPYEKHKELRVENATLKEQLQSSQAKLEELLKAKDDAKGDEVATEEADKALAAHLDVLKEDMPELHQLISAVIDGNKRQAAKLEKALAELERDKEESKRVSQQTVAEQVAEAKDNNPDLVHWETSDPEAWDEAMKQDEILRTTTKWREKSFAERFDEVVRRVRAVMPEASVPNKPKSATQIAADAKAKLEKAPARQPTTLSDVPGGADPASESEKFANLSPFELTQKLMKMPASTAAALRADLD